MATPRQQEIKRKLKARERAIEGFVNRLDRFLEVNVQEILGEVESGSIKGIEAARILGGLQTALVEAGMQRELGRLIAIYGDELEEIQAAVGKVAGRAVPFSNLDMDTIEALIQFDADMVQSRIFTYIDDVKATVMQSLIAGSPVNLKALHQDYGLPALGNIKTEVSTTIAGFQRSVSQKKAQDVGLELFLYLGPDDDVTRPFCEERVGQVFDIDQIRDWDNGQGLPADIYLGGYNCRHQLVPVTEEEAREEYGYRG